MRSARSVDGQVPDVHWGSDQARGEELEVAVELENVSDGMQVARKVVEAIRNTVIEFEGQTFTVTASVGIAELKEDEDLDGLIKRANWAMKGLPPVRCIGVATRTRRWDSCFSLDFGYVHGGTVRPSLRARYRQWLTHKLAGWIDQFGTSGCVGCGRCITWCPVGIDLTEEAAAIRATDGERRDADR